MSHKHLLPPLGPVLIALGVVKGGWFLLLVWLGADFFILGLAHWAHAHHLLGKRANGTLPLWTWALFLPLLLYYRVIWHLLRLLSRESAYSTVTDNLAVGRRLLASEVHGNFDNYIDLTAEFVEPAAIRRSPGYRCFPILDDSAPTPEALRQSIEGLRPGRTFVHCALGHGRSGLYALALLLSSGAARTIEDGLSMLKKVRPGVRLNQEQWRCIREYAVTMHREESSRSRGSMEKSA